MAFVGWGAEGLTGGIGRCPMPESLTSNSAHKVWFELHEDLIAIGLTR